IIADKMTGPGNSSVEHSEIWFHLWQRGVDHRAIGAAVRGLREKIRHDILAHQQWVDLRVDERDPLLRPSAFDRLPGREERAVESVVDIKADRARLAEGHIAVTHDWDLAKGVDGIDLRAVRHGR